MKRKGAGISATDMPASKVFANPGPRLSSSDVPTRGRKAARV
jgi:hypothetical protein